MVEIYIQEVVGLVLRMTLSSISVCWSVLEGLGLKMSRSKCFINPWLDPVHVD
jgi:hypothetical protein